MTNTFRKDIYKKYLRAPRCIQYRRKLYDYIEQLEYIFNYKNRELSVVNRTSDSWDDIRVAAKKELPRKFK